VKPVPMASRSVNHLLGQSVARLEDATTGQPYEDYGVLLEDMRMRGSACPDLNPSSG
jgi:hypothetical protein